MDWLGLVLLLYSFAFGSAFSHTRNLRSKLSMACSRSEQVTVRFHLISRRSSLAPADLLSSVMKMTSPSSLAPLLVTLDPSLSKEILESEKVSIIRELQVNKGTLSSSRGKRKLPKSEEPYPIREVKILPDLSATWLAVMDDWDVSNIGSLPFFRRQVKNNVFEPCQKDLLCFFLRSSRSLPRSSIISAM